MTVGTNREGSCADAIRQWVTYLHRGGVLDESRAPSLIFTEIALPLLQIPVSPET